jgi:hypothetical protein
MRGIKVPHPERLHRPLSCIITWQSLEDYLTDAEEHGAHKSITDKFRRPDHENAKHIKSFSTSLVNSELIPTRKRQWDIGGGTLDVGRYLSGEPECFASIQYQHGRNIRLVFSPEVHKTSHPLGLALRGGAVMGLVDALEAQGNSVEIWVGWDNTVGKDKYESRILLKRAGEYSSAPELAGPFCDRDFLQKCEFPLIRSLLQTYYVGINEGITLEGDIVIDGSWRSMRPFDSEESTRQWIVDMQARINSGQLKTLQG